MLPKRFQTPFHFTAPFLPQFEYKSLEKSVLFFIFMKLLLIVVIFLSFISSFLSRCIVIWLLKSIHFCTVRLTTQSFFCYFVSLKVATSANG